MIPWWSWINAFVKYVCDIMHSGPPGEMIALWPKGPFIYYVITFLSFLDTLPPLLRKHIFYVLKIIKNNNFLTPLPPSNKCLRHIWMVPKVKFAKKYVTKIFIWFRLTKIHKTCNFLNHLSSKFIINIFNYLVVYSFQVY